MTIDGYSFKYKIKHTYTNTKYSSMILTVAVAEWLAHFHSD